MIIAYFISQRQILVRTPVRVGVCAVSPKISINISEKQHFVGFYSKGETAVPRLKHSILSYKELNEHTCFSVILSHYTAGSFMARKPLPERAMGKRLELFR